MNVKLPFLKRACCLLLAVAGFSINSGATHFQGSDLIYTSVAPGVYIVTAKVYRDCSGIPLSTAILLNIKAPNCNAGRTIQMPKVIGSQGVGNLYCPSILVPCTSTATLPNYETANYRATVSFSAAEQACTDWYLSFSECCRPTIENLVGQGNFYSEAFLKLGATISNNSPEFGSLVVPYLNYNMPVTYSNNAVEADGDSIAYSLVRPLSALNVPVAYNSNTNVPGPMVMNPNPAPPFNTTNNPQYAQLSGVPYSATMPIPSFSIDWNVPNSVVQGVPYFDLDPQSGSISFTPSIYHPNTQPSAGRNKYAFVVQADEFRKINGVVTKVGHIRREMMVTVIDCGPNSNPVIPRLSFNNHIITPSTTLSTRPGIPITLQFTPEDLNSNDVLNVTSDVTNVLPGATFSKTSGNHPTCTISWTPTAADVRNLPYYFTVEVRDNACPLNGIHSRVIGLRVTANGAVTAVTSDNLTNTGFMAYPNPFGATTNFRINVKTKSNQEILIYNALGQQVDKIKLSGLQAGEQTIEWKNAPMQAAGQYVAKLIGADNSIQTIKFSKLQ